MDDVDRVNITDPEQIKSLINNIGNFVFGVFIALSVFFLLWAAFSYLTAAGSADKLKSAKDKLIYAAIGIALAIVSKSLPILISNFIGSNV
ncbi:MAG: hypothetical protein WC565_02255 [Parcubacteria group bacterium]